MIIYTSTYPKGQHWKLEAEHVVQRIETVCGQQRLRDCYVAELCNGDEYFIPAASKETDTPRTDAMILSWMEENGIENYFHHDIDGKPESLELCNKHGHCLVKYPYGKGCLKEACEFVMDEEDRKRQEDDLDYLVHRNERGEL
jgi:hypothetical protein